MEAALEMLGFCSKEKIQYKLLFPTIGAPEVMCCSLGKTITAFSPTDFMGFMISK